MLDNEMIQTLIARAREARKKAYAPYSNFMVGSALLMENGDIFDGCNVENASYGLANCAERTAVFKAVSERLGDEMGVDNRPEVKAIALVGGMSGDEESTDIITPCGACRQVLAQFSLNKDMQVIMAPLSGDAEPDILTIEELIPTSFTL